MTLSEAYNVLLLRLAGTPPRFCLSAVNSFWNGAIVDTPDAEAWGEAEYWPTLDEIMDKFGRAEKARGACATYALAKCGTLYRLGARGAVLSYAEVVCKLTGIGHMVTLYGYEPDQLVLDMLPGYENTIVPIDRRTDLALRTVHQYDTGAEL